MALMNVSFDGEKQASCRYSASCLAVLSCWKMMFIEGLFIFGVKLLIDGLGRVGGGKGE